MCKPDSRIKLCTCTKEKDSKKLKHNKNYRKWTYKLNKEEYLETEILWVLNRCLGENNSDMHWLFFGPNDKLSKEISSEFMLHELNNNLELFDFDYLPELNDEIRLRMEYKNPKLKNKPRPYLHDYISFVFKKDGWVKDYLDPNHYSTAEISNGKLKFY